MEKIALLVATAEGLFRLQHGEVQELLGETAYAIHVDCDILAVALGTHGIAISVDRGITWSRSGQLGCSVVSIARNPADPLVLIAGTQPAGALISTDRGVSWRPLVNAMDVAGTEAWEIPIRDPSKKEISESAGAGAATWNVVFDPARLGRIVLGVEVGGLLVSDDFGENWRVMPVGDTPDPHVICMHPADPNVVLISTGFSRFTEEVGVFSYSNTGGVYRSDDAFDNFRSVWPPDPEPQYTRAMCWDASAPYPVTVCVRSSYVQASNPAGERRAVVKQSVDAGMTWRTLGDTEHSSYHEEFSAITPDPRTTGDVFVVTEHGQVFHVAAADDCWTAIGRVPGSVAAIAVDVTGDLN